MTVNVTLLQTAEDCDNALDIINAEKIQLERRMRNLGERLEGQSSSTTDLSEGIAAVTSIISGYSAAVEVITDEKEKRNLELKIQREEAKLKALENRQANYSPVAVVEDEVDYEQLAVQIPVLTEAITQIETHKATL